VFPPRTWRSVDKRDLLELVRGRQITTYSQRSLGFVYTVLRPAWVRYTDPRTAGNSSRESSTRCSPPESFHGMVGDRPDVVDPLLRSDRMSALMPVSFRRA
jgi:hypothetical protein